VGQNPYLCESGQCNKKKKKNTVTPIVASISGVLILLIAVAIFWILKRKKSKGNAEVIKKSSYFLLTIYQKVIFNINFQNIVEKFTDSVAVNHQSEISQKSIEKGESFLQRKSQMYSYYDVLQITNNFNRIIGKGGFGTVYLGFIDETPVAVKMLCPSAVHGYQQFQAEVGY